MKITKELIESMVREELESILEDEVLEEASADPIETLKFLRGLLKSTAARTEPKQAFETALDAINSALGGLTEEEGELEEGAKAGEVYCKHRKQPGGFYRKPPCPAGMDTQKPNRGRKYGDAAPAPKVGFSGFLEE